MLCTQGRVSLSTGWVRTCPWKKGLGDKEEECSWCLSAALLASALGSFPRIGFCIWGATGSNYLPLRGESEKLDTAPSASDASAHSQTMGTVRKSELVNDHQHPNFMRKYQHPGWIWGHKKALFLKALFRRTSFLGNASPENNILHLFIKCSWIIYTTLTCKCDSFWNH